MKEAKIYPYDQVLWSLNNKSARGLAHDVSVEVVVIGGGIAGLSAAQTLREKGYTVALIEQYYCGSGATGKSSGFITPDSELNLTDFSRRFGLAETKKVWDFVTVGVEKIRDNIKKFSIECNYQEEDTFVVANSVGRFKLLQREHEMRLKLSYESFLYQKDEIPGLIGSEDYYGGLRYGNTFGIDMYRYCQGMKEVLKSQGVQIYEETPALAIEKNVVLTPHAQIKADKIVVCVDRFLPALHKLADTIYHVQTFITVSEPLSDDVIKKIFPQKNLMVWDTDLIYQYYRIVDDNRFLIGGSTYLASFWGHEQHNHHAAFKKLSNYALSKFPDTPLNFVYFWPGLIGVTKDLRAIAGFDADNSHIYYICGTTGLPWGAALGWYSAEKIADKRDDLDHFFDPYRTFPVGKGMQYIFGKRFAFSLSMLVAKGKLGWLGL